MLPVTELVVAQPIYLELEARQNDATMNGILIRP